MEDRWCLSQILMLRPGSQTQVPALGRGHGLKFKLLFAQTWALGNMGSGRGQPEMRSEWCTVGEHAARISSCVRGRRSTLGIEVHSRLVTAGVALHPTASFSPPSEASHSCRRFFIHRPEKHHSWVHVWHLLDLPEILGEVKGFQGYKVSRNRWDLDSSGVASYSVVASHVVP